jgi:hypothetical protein
MDPRVVAPPSERLAVDPRGVSGVVRPPPARLGVAGYPRRGFWGWPEVNRWATDHPNGWSATHVFSSFFYSFFLFCFLIIYFIFKKMWDFFSNFD